MANLITLINFDGTDGAIPSGSLIADAAGDLFGTTQGGGTINVNYGTVFEIPYIDGNYASTPITLVDFNNADGEGPTGGLIADAAGDLFGVTGLGGAGAQETFDDLGYGTV